MDFKDRENDGKVIELINNSKDVNDAQNIIMEYYPGWLVDSFSCYSSDYPHLQENWEKICGMLGSTPVKIVIVSEIKFDSDHKTINSICNFMTKNGYCVRREGEFIPCDICHKAIPCEEIWNLLKSKKFPVPEVWSTKCTKC